MTAERVQAAPALKPTKCAICGTTGNATEVYPSSVTEDAFDARHFSARRVPDRVHYRMVRCNRCGLLRSDPAADPASVARLYERATFDYSSEVPNIQRTYGRYLRRVERYIASRAGLLEVGSGNGFFLEEALRQGYRDARGIEPSQDAIDAAKPEIRPLLIHDILRRGVVEEESVALACLFHVFDHLAEPGDALDTLHHILRPKGVVLFLNHDAGALSARVMGERSPIVDVEHYYLYTPQTQAALAQAHGFEVLEAGAVLNDYTLGYVARLTPMPSRVKGGVLGALQATRAGSLRVRVPLGNLYLIARRR